MATATNKFEQPTIISVACWNRPIYLLKILDGLLKALQFGPPYPFKLLISCDHLDACNAQQILEAIECSNILKFVDTDLVFHDKNLGCTGNTRFCLEKGFENNEQYTIHLEDDTYPSLDLIEYFAQVWPLLDNGYFAACTFHRPCHQLQAPSLGDVYKLVAKNVFEGAGGFAITRKQWERIQEMGGMFGVEYVPDFAKKYDCRGEVWKSAVAKSDRLGFDWAFDRYFSEGKPCLFPIVSRVLNIGKHGLHLNPTQWQVTHFNPNWAHDPRYSSIYKYKSGWPNADLTNILIDNNKYTESGYE
jgi:hypothetical protein